MDPVSKKNMTLHSRRNFLRGVGAVTLGAMVGPRLVQQASAARSNGTVVFIYDDGPIEDYTKTYQVHQEFDAPACTAAISGAVGASGRLSAAQLHELEDAGWEIMSHTVNHRALDEVTVTRDVAPGDERIYVRSAIHGRAPGPILVSDGESSATVRVTGNGKDARGQYLELDGAVGRRFTAADGVTERYTDEVIRHELGGSKRALTDLGLSVSNFVVPYYRYGRRTRELAPQYYTAVANGYYGGINPVDRINLAGMNRTYFRTSYRTLDEVGEWLDQVAEGGHLGLLGGHSNYDTLPAQRIRDTLRMARERNLQIKTLRQALWDLGVVPRPTPTPDPGSGGGGPVPSTAFEMRTFNFDDAWRRFRFQQEFADPVVVAPSLTHRGSHPSHPRVRDVTDTSFRARVEEWEYLDGDHVSERAGILIAERGRGTADGGNPFEAGRVSVDHDWERVTFDRAFDEPPAVFAHPTTVEGTDPVVARVTSVGRDGFSVRVQEEEANNDNHTYERVDWFAIQPGRGTIGGRRYETGRLREFLDDDWRTLSFDRSYAQPTFVAALSSTIGTNPCSVRYDDLSSTGVDLFVEEEQSADTEVGHVREDLSYFVIEG